MVVRTRETAQGDRVVGFKLQGFDKATAEANPLQEGDKLAVYVGRPVSGFVATVEISGARFVSDERIWELSENPSELFPIRYPAEPRVMVVDREAVRFRELIDELEFSRYLRNPDRGCPARRGTS